MEPSSTTTLCTVALTRLRWTWFRMSFSCSSFTAPSIGKAWRGRIEKDRLPAQPLLIYPADSKFRLTYDQPFLENISRFQLALRKPGSAVVVIGSGLRDAHLAQPLRAAVHANVTQMYLVVAPRLENSTSELVGHLQDLVRQGDARIFLLEATFSDLVELMPMIHGQSEDESHQDRLQAARLRESE